MRLFYFFFCFFYGHTYIAKIIIILPSLTKFCGISDVSMSPKQGESI